MISKDKYPTKTVTERMKIIKQREPDIIITHVAEAQNKV